MNLVDAKRILETALICSQQPMPVRDMRALFSDSLGADSLKSLLEELKDMKRQVDRAILGVRNVASRLRPAALDMGLVPAIEWLCMQITQHSEVECALHGAEQPLELDESRAIVIFRIVQESLTNISKYAQACEIDITLEQGECELSVEIRDNGLGFDVDAVARRGSLGLLGMRERAIALGGRLVVTSAPGQGTRVNVVIPMESDRIGPAP